VSTISKPRIIKGRSASDLHFGAAHTPASRIAYGLDRLMSNDEVFSECDLILYPGDITERLLPQPSLEAQVARNWMDRNIELAEKHGTVLGVVEGTPMHDWFQSEYFVESNNIRGNKASLYYIKEVKIVYMEELGIHVLFVPDEAHDTCQLTQIAVENALREAGLEQVDLTVIHGQFRHQYPEHLRDIGMDFHDSDFYLSITRHFIFAGHVHTHSIYKRIVAQGSFERLHHGYEAPKGCVGFELNLDDPSKSKVWFIENHDAMIYKTFHVKGDNLQYEADRIRLLASQQPSGSFLRVKAKSGHPILTMIKEFKKELPMFNWTTDVEKEKKKVVKEIIPAKIKRARISIRPENIAELLKDRLEVLPENLQIDILNVLEKCK
jgi:hypothetical protein